MNLRVADYVTETRVEGPGLRSALWLQGCPLRCPDCCNPEMWKASGGRMLSVERVYELLVTPEVEGVSFLGGEPFSQAEGLAALAGLIQGSGRSVMVYSGYTLEELSAREDVATQALLGQCDILVDGRYESGQPESVRRWIGSTNQKMHFLSERYSQEDSCFLSSNSIEIRWKPGQLTVVGWPGASAQVSSQPGRSTQKRISLGRKGEGAS